MNWLEQLNASLIFIEENITEDIRSDDVSRMAFSSHHHFMRMFYLLSGINLGEYIRNRRLTLAASDIISTNQKIIDIALKYQYNTPESFSKAFKRFHGVSPSDARKIQTTLKIQPKLSFQINLRGDYIMDYKILKKTDLNFRGFVKEVTTIDGENFKVIPKFWNEVMGSNIFQNLINNSDDLGVVGVCYGFDNDSSTFKYMIGVRTTEEIEGAVDAAFGDEVFAEFKAVGPLPAAMQNVIQQVFNEWFPSSNYEHSGGPEIEVYSVGDGSSEDYVSYYWVPIKEK